MSKNVAHPSIPKALLTQKSSLLKFEPWICYSLHKVCYYGENCGKPVDAYPRSASGVEDQVTDIRVPCTKVSKGYVILEMTYRC